MVRKRVFSKKCRNAGNRKVKKILLISAEGNKNNKTERIYFSHFNKGHVEVRFISGNETDPEAMMKRLVDAKREYELTNEDMAICLVDSDFDKTRDKVLQRVENISTRETTSLVVSAPSFEVWYLCHFRYSTKQYQNNQNVIHDLKQFIPDYEKGKDIYSLLQEKEEVAIENAKKLEAWCKGNSKKYHRVEFMPSTDVYKVMQWIQANR